ncbi:probable V-type proton ATPase subunit d [Saccharomycodes ludwigii]|uniref:V-type proton ATPase subunit n=1 Tax=Saccharomycodes ludwigii TaxID=36035 RepID=A0A376B2U6_9ASCO|nr:hypothetical protein SCDLUD_004338 [Saccharomycodes ludwigii]KAH3900021.1 hypothetical protein SCDLUD_004338 [Saccharomycodes ludwigii]SSD58804.1 probable V-type proton ATPase subunit d [Saccharomycodes ludwigii]
MEGLYFNIDNGYLEGVIRGYRNGLLTSHQYLNLTQCDTLDDLKLQLSSTDYGNFLSNVSSEQLTTSSIQENTSARLYNEFNYIRDNSSGITKKFMDYMTYAYMIDNVALMITGTIHNRDKAEMLNRCHPLGWFDTLPTLSVATDLESLYQMVLVDTPLSPYFRDCFGDSYQELDDMNIEIIKNKLYKQYLQDFYHFVSTELENPTKENMQEILNFEADRRTINIVLNSLEHPEVLDLDLKKQLIPEMGKLYPIGQQQLLVANDLDFESIKNIIESTVYEYRGIFETNGSSSAADSDIGNNASSSSNLEDHFYQLELDLCKDCFTQQFTLSTIWAWMKSKEQEVRNITWISECIAQNQREKINNYISVY